MNYAQYLQDLKTCPFCVAPNVKFLENDTAFLTFSAAPYHADHLLVVPKRHVEHILDLTDEEVVDMYVLQKKGLQILKSLGYSNISMLIKEGDRKEKTIAHVHYHVVPEVVLKDSVNGGDDRPMLTEAEIVALVKRIHGVLNT